MEKIRIQNVRTGKVMEITKMAWEQLKIGGHSKIFDLIPSEKPVIKFNVLKPEPTSEETTLEETTSEETKPEPIESTEPTPKKRTRKTTK
jgi:hypothetical protein